MEYYRQKLKEGEITFDDYKSFAVSASIDYLEDHLDYQFVRHIGYGSYGTVIEVKDRKKQQSVAAKIVLEVSVKDSEREIWPRLANKNILKLIRVHHIQSTSCYVFITQMCASDLRELIELYELPSDTQAFEKSISWLRDVCKALAYLHRRRLCHLDLKLSNVLLNEDMALLSDFGCLTRTDYGETNRYLCPRLYRPPEALVIERNGLPATVNGYKLDIFTLGMLCLELFTCQALAGSSELWSGKRVARLDAAGWWQHLYPLIFDMLQKRKFEYLVKTAFKKSKIRTQTLCHMRDFIRGCMNLDPEKRPSAVDLLQHNLFGGKKSFRALGYDAWLNKCEPNALVIDDNLNVNHKEQPCTSKKNEDLYERNEPESISTEYLKNSIVTESVEPEDEKNSMKSNNSKSEVAFESAVQDRVRRIPEIRISIETQFPLDENQENERDTNKNSSEHPRHVTLRIYSVPEQTEKAVNSTEFKKEQTQSTQESSFDHEMKEHLDGSESSEFQSEDISSTCGSCSSQESEFVKIKTKREKFRDWLSRKKSCISKGFYKLFCCCRKNKNDAS